jgi:hypothetical protein
MTFSYAIMMNAGSGNDASFQDGAAITLGVCYLQLLAYLKSIFIDFAVFVSGVVFVVGRLGAFMICIFIAILAFAQMWWTLFRQSRFCASDMGDDFTNIAAMLDDEILNYYDDAFFLPEEEGVEDCEPQIEFPFCTSMYWSVYTTYTMLFGLTDYVMELSTLSLVLVCLFLMIMIMMLLNILVAIITDLFGEVTNESASIVFWSNRLAYITDMVSASFVVFN